MSTSDLFTQCGEDPMAILEKQLAEQYLGRSIASLCHLPQEEACRLLKAAYQYAALRRTEIEAKARVHNALK